MGDQSYAEIMNEIKQIAYVLFIKGATLQSLPVYLQRQHVLFMKRVITSRLQEGVIDYRWVMDQPYRSTATE